MINEDKVIAIVASLYPDFTEYADNSKFFYLMDYACQLDVIQETVDRFPDKDVLKEMLNTKISTLRSGSAEHDACVDVASNLEEAMPDQFKGVFKYE